MKIFWVDPLNTNPHAVNLIAVILREVGHDVHICSVSRAGHPPPPDVHWIPFAGYRSPPSSLKTNVFAALRLVGFYPFFWRRAVHCALTSGVKVVLVTTNLTLWRQDAWAMRLMARSGLARVAIVHKPYPGVFDDPAGEQAARYRTFYQSATRILTFNAFTRKLMQTLYQLPGDRYSQLPHPHFQPLLDRFSTSRALAFRLHEWAAGFPVIAFLSNMRPEQGLDDLLSSLAILNAEHADWRLLLVSSGGDKSQIRRLKRRLAELGLQGRSWFHPGTYSYSSLKAYLEAASVVVVPYRWATQSSVVAMATGAGVPIVATSVGGLSEMVHPGVTGELVPPRNPARLAQALVKVVSHRERYRRETLIWRDALYSPQRTAVSLASALRAAAGNEDAAMYYEMAREGSC